MMLTMVFMLVLVFVVLVECIPVESCFPSSGVASLRPRLGGEPPWFTIFISLMHVLIDSLGNLEFLLPSHVHKIRGCYCV